MYNPTDNPNYSREYNSGALINNNVSELKLMKAQRDKFLQQQNEMKQLRAQVEDFETLKSEIEQIKILLTKGGINV